MLMTSAGSSFTIATYRGREGLARIQGDWDRVVRGLEHPRFFHFYAWYWSYLDALEPDDSALLFFVAYRDGEPVAVFPFKSGARVRRGVKVRFLETPSHPHVPRWDCIGAPKLETRGALRALLKHLARAGVRLSGWRGTTFTCSSSSKTPAPLPGSKAIGRR